jgi:ABC-type nitrate/sulfonate/bicarbonate transport system permease component
MLEASVAEVAPIQIRLAALARPRWTLRGIVDPLGVAGVIVAIAIWEIISLAAGTRVPGPAAVFTNAIGNLTDSTRLPGIGLPRGGYLPHLLFTIKTVLIAGALGVVIGTATGVFCAENRRANAILDPIVSALGTVPIVVAAPFFLMWFGVAGGSQIALVGFYTAVVLHLFAFRASQNLLPQYMDYGATLGVGSVQRMLAIRLPGVLPEVFGGLRVALASAWGLSAVTEMLGAQYGTGRVLVALRSVYDLTGILAVVLLLGVIAIAADLLVLAVRSYVLRWRPKEITQ